MPDRVPLVHRHRQKHHYHYEDPQAAMEEGAMADAQHAHGGPAMSPLNAAAVGDGDGGARSSKGGTTPAADGVAAGKAHASPPASTGFITPRNRVVGFLTGALKSPKAGPAVPAPRPPPHLSKSWPWILFGSLTLTFNAGYVNTLTLNTIRAMPSAHVTGMVARASNLLAMGDFSQFAIYAAAYVCFVAGACLGGIVINYETFYLGRNYGRALFLTAALQGVSLVIENEFNNSVFFIFSCCLAMGLQNSLTSKYSGSVVRTTHLTGASTDLGIALGHIIKGRSEEWWKVKLHTTALFGFFCGGFCGYYAFRKFEHAALLINIALTTACAIIHTIYVAYHERMSVVKVLESRSDIRLHKHRVGPSPGHHLERSPGRITPSGRYVPGGRMTPSGRFTPTVGRQRSFFASGMALGVEGSQHGAAAAPQLDPVGDGRLKKKRQVEMLALRPSSNAPPLSSAHHPSRHPSPRPAGSGADGGESKSGAGGSGRALGVSSHAQAHPRPPLHPRPGQPPHPPRLPVAGAAVGAAAAAAASSGSRGRGEETDDSNTQSPTGAEEKEKEEGDGVALAAGEEEGEGEDEYIPFPEEEGDVGVVDFEDEDVAHEVLEEEEELLAAGALDGAMGLETDWGGGTGDGDDDDDGEAGVLESGGEQGEEESEGEGEGWETKEEAFVRQVSFREDA